MRIRRWQARKGIKSQIKNSLNAGEAGIEIEKLVYIEIQLTDSANPIQLSKFPNKSPAYSAPPPARFRVITNVKAALLSATVNSPIQEGVGIVVGESAMAVVDAEAGVEVETEIEDARGNGAVFTPVSALLVELGLGRDIDVDMAAGCCWEGLRYVRF